MMSTSTPHPPRTSETAATTETDGTAPLAYHRLARGWAGYRWWKPLLVGVIGAGIYVGFMIAAMLGVVIAGLVSPGFARSMDRVLSGPGLMDMNDPFVLIPMLASLALMIPALWLATLILGAKPVGLLSSVVGRLRWTWLLWCLGAALVINVIAQFVAQVLPGTTEAGEFRYDGGTTLALLAAALLVVPFQAAAEEYVFRGYLMQTLGGWLRHPAFAILLPVPLFVIGHDYELLGQIDIAVFAIAAGWLSWRTGGLEAAMALHIVGNASIFVFVAFGVADANADDVGLVDLLLSVAVTVVTVLVLARLSQVRNIQRRRRPEAVPLGRVPETLQQGKGAAEPER
ncbi:MAG: CPBP family intramembrane metalloprotease [Micrococcaceae bacterium]|nr:CPBP family intramembrane metalloprotease [Micrococcaceae bacterium]MDN5823563.1 CPBP family intramembrane metalloprotease [Micrococcaceae bacterium]MDN5880620.1 CPBP family intramembrane metalloprotease [Micrococcaceae bacterium]MDN5887982.1 CPBP family intramembrane metalloprotease [Micrococcaceae bacterium]MDN5905753.1 CPBP family intramembrane metalloprotease [Micrococcaceae bacterium]